MMLYAGENNIRMIIRKPLNKDKEAIYELYKIVALNGLGIARVEEEITAQYIDDTFRSVEKQGVMLVGIDEESQELIAEIHATKYGIRVFEHNLTHLTIVVHPNFQRVGNGKQIFQAFLEEIVANRPEIKRVELESRASNQRSIGLYKQLGFVQEGKMKNKTKNTDGSFEDSLLMAWTSPR